MMYLTRNLPVLLLGTGLLLAPATAAWAQDASPSDETLSTADEAPTPQLKVTADAPAATQKPAWTFDFSGYMRTKFTTIQNDPNFALIGRRDGFSFANVFLDARGKLDNGMGFDVSVEAAAGLPKGAGDDASVELSTRLQDAIIYYAPHALLRASVGQFKAPFDAETLQSSARLLFIHRSIGARGVSGVEGMPVGGLSQGRQTGLRLDSKPFYFLNDSADAAPAGPGVSYALALTNGQRDNLRFNDNEKLAYFGRINLHWGDMVRLGGAGFSNERTLGAAPDRLSQDNVGWTGDLNVRAYGVSLFTSIAQVEITPAPELQADQSRTARSIQFQIAYEEPFLGFQPAYRFATYDTNTGEDAPNSAAYEALTYHTLGLNYNSPDYPVRLMFNYTITGEDERPIDNNRFDALAQIVW